MFPGKFLARRVMWDFRVKNHETWLHSKNQALYDMTPCQSVNSYEHFGGNSLSYYQGKVLAVAPRIWKTEAAKQPVKSVNICQSTRRPVQ